MHVYVFFFFLTKTHICFCIPSNSVTCVYICSPALLIKITAHSMWSIYLRQILNMIVNTIPVLLASCIINIDSSHRMYLNDGKWKSTQHKIDLYPGLCNGMLVSTCTSICLNVLLLVILIFYTACLEILLMLITNVAMYNHGNIVDIKASFFRWVKTSTWVMCVKLCISTFHPLSLTCSNISQR